jgi:hypothetical protein
MPLSRMTCPACGADLVYDSHEAAIAVPTDLSGTFREMGWLGVGAIAERKEKLLSSGPRRGMGEKGRDAAEAFPLERIHRETHGCLARVWEEGTVGPW